METMKTPIFGKKAVVTFDEQDSELVRIYLNHTKVAADYLNYIDVTSDNKSKNFYNREFIEAHSQASIVIEGYLWGLFLDTVRISTEFV